MLARCTVSGEVTDLEAPNVTVQAPCACVRVQMGGGLAPLLRIRSHGETENMRRLCAVFVAEMSMAEGMQELIGELDAITR